MKTTLAIALAALLPASLTAESKNPAILRPIMAMGAYVPTDDMNGSEAFYRVLFDRAPVIGLPDFIAFDIAGGWFAIVLRDKYAPGSEPGSGAVPYLQSTDLEALQTRVTSAGATAPEIIEEPGIHLLKIRDPNGQLIEFFKLTSE